MSGKRLLVACDEEGIATYIEYIAAGSGLEAVTVASGTEALSVFVAAIERTPRFDILVTDLELPGLCGERLIDMAVKRDPSLPVVVMSGRQRPGDSEISVHPTMWRFVQKPFGRKELLEALEVAGYNAGLRRTTS